MEWIKYPEKRPEEMIDVLILRSSGEMLVGHWGSECDPEHCWMAFAHNDDMSDCLYSEYIKNVTHWMSLPPLPKEKSNFPNEGVISIPC